ncbi:MAG: 4-(cytidine 5'-diphospho)-2-C-methyl-D-erythritol kinase [Deltaproteobacteria bacterium]|nr:4-(cytidine 5'-diphospho)-2-C-methyl-D-erythritol kinase [Deltaproteobacteria bacterium]
MKVHAHAKINLFLRVIRKRPDGYHEIETLMCPIELHDTVRLSFNKNEISVSCTGPYIPDIPEGRENIARLAAARFFAATGKDGGVHIEIVKRIPAGAGLGGGSSDAAAVLSGLNNHYSRPLCNAELRRLAATIGADVPFFISCKPAVATGIGEILSPCPDLPSAHLVLVYPGCAVSTALVYKNLKIGLTKSKKINKKINFSPPGPDWGRSGYGRGYFQEYLHNDLEPVATKICPLIADAKKRLLECNAQSASMTGSGSAVFGLYSDPDKAGHAAAKLAGINEWSVFLTRLMV